MKQNEATIIPSPFFRPRSKQVVSLLSANVRIFNVYSHLRDNNYASSKGFVHWLAASPADILCLQEYYNEPKGSAENGTIFRTERRLGVEAGRQAAIHAGFTNIVGAQFGLAIFSRFPIVRKGFITFGKTSLNHGMWVDVVRPAPLNDTLRIFNMHLQSMSLGEENIVAAASSETGLRHEAPDLLRRFRYGAIARASQVDTMLARVARSPYPVLLTGDCNDPPYSYTYDQLADHLQNAWASVGNGLGATYNGRLRALRIDNQFASKEWEVLDCRVHREIPWSDHFPIEGLYELKK